MCLCVWNNIMFHTCMGVPYEYMHDRVAIFETQ